MLTTRKSGLTTFRCILGFIVLSCGAASLTVIPADEQQSNLARAKSFENQGLFDDAVKEYHAILEEFSSSQEARRGLGRSLASLGRCQEAAKALKGMVQGRGDTETLVGVCYFRTHNYNLAITHLEQAARLAPGAKEPRIYLSRSYAAQGRYHEAIATLKTWLARSGDDVDALYWIGKFYEELGTTALQKMAEAHPNSYLLYEAQGEQYLDRKEYKKALKAFDRALALGPDAPSLHYWRGNVYWRQRSLYKAQEELETELRSNPFHAQANYLLGDIYVSLREPDKAIPFLERAVALNPGIWDAHRSLGRALVMRNRIQEAVREFQIVAKANANDDTIHGLLSNAYRRLGEVERAKEEEQLFEKLNAARRERVPKPSVDNPPVASPPE